MPTVNFAAIAVVVIAAFVLSTVYYVVFGKTMAALLGRTDEEQERPQPWQIAIELVRSLVLAYVLARFVALQDITDVAGGASLACWTWLAFPAVLLSGSVMWDKVPVRLAAIHAGDWFIKILMMCLVLALWR